MPLKVISAGFGRTGTNSLKLALEELGFNKCYHMYEVSQNPGHAIAWHKAYYGHKTDWDTLLKDYQATTDWPACTFYRQLMQHYPEAKIILTIRDPEKWYNSTLNTIYPSSTKKFINFIGYAWARRLARYKMINAIIWEGTFHNQFENKKYALEVFKHHIEEVKRTVPPKRLLIYEVKQGWEPLCEFLQVPIPKNKPFPHVNDRQAFQQTLQQRNRISQLLVTAFLLVSSIVMVGLIKNLRK